ncbi:MAG TPA: tetraacyldisaccharide 4'-kinase [Candidatus Ozemobacteraceae bacterium]|nr:tetraacyldisaccharide 4'-kinase [Candidatus Ozemobacteraceae bacterium]
MSILLSRLSRFYAWLAETERRFFETVSFLVERPDARVISVGNLSVGGTGKTPFLFELLSDPALPANRVVLTRGYRSPWERGFYLMTGTGPHPKALTDEARLLASMFPDLPVLIGKNRAHSARLAEQWFKPDVMLLDDGFQYRRLKRDIDIVLWDALMPEEHARPLPLGRLREAPERLRDADLIVLTRCELADDGQKNRWRGWLNFIAPDIPILEMRTEPGGWINPEGQRLPVSDGPGRILAFAAIAKPETFAAQLKAAGRDIAETHGFRDHDGFSAERLSNLSEAARRLDAVLVCTTKDRIKIPAEVAARHGIWTLEIRMRPDSGNSLSEEMKRCGIDLATCRRKTRSS